MSRQDVNVSVSSKSDTGKKQNTTLQAASYRDGADTVVAGAMLAGSATAGEQGAHGVRSCDAWGGC